MTSFSKTIGFTSGQVLESTGFVFSNANVTKHVKVNGDRIRELAVGYAGQDLSVPKWDAPVFLEKNDKIGFNEIIDFMFLGNCINFAYNDFETGVTYSNKYKGGNWGGAFGMWSSLRDAIEKGVPLLDGRYLANLTIEDARSIFEKDSKIPMLEDRVEILNEVGRTLCEKYDGHFHNLVLKSDGKLFNNGDGLIERLIKDFPSFDDRSEYKGTTIVLNKRAQLAVAMTWEKLHAIGKDIMDFNELLQLTVFADYELPKVLRFLGVLVYSKELAYKIDNGIAIEHGSEEEVEIRAATVYAANLLMKMINEIAGSEKANALNIDFKLWSEGSKNKLAMGNAHRCKTRAY